MIVWPMIFLLNWIMKPWLNDLTMLPQNGTRDRPVSTATTIIVQPTIICNQAAHNMTTARVKMTPFAPSFTWFVLCLRQCWCTFLNAALLLFHALCGTCDMLFINLLINKTMSEHVRTCSTDPVLTYKLLWQRNAIPTYTGRVEYMTWRKSIRVTVPQYGKMQLLYLSCPGQVPSARHLMLGINPFGFKGQVLNWASKLNVAEMWDMVVGCELFGAEIAHHCKAMGAPSYIFPYFSLRIVPFDIHAPITLVWCAFSPQWTTNRATTLHHRHQPALPLSEVCPLFSVSVSSVRCRH